ncbi:sigma-70 family RNA polymerase sigma factor [Streptomyces sp. uw30]|uniref:sigma-70 family RNA polymerase sigma factor n=1 Tax=Streptomyces sp. uw30 TaxID=1828179 RepID=UPI0016516F43|nr:sigma-70 family RNA polymerase sigma factor [Streptomyces sp. uw30]
MVDKQDETPTDAEAHAAASRSHESDITLAELRRRHRDQVLAYAYTCCRDPESADDLTSEAFARALSDARAGSAPTVAWRPYLLALVRRTAADWADTARRAELSSDFQQWLTDSQASTADGTEPETIQERLRRREDDSAVLTAFRSLPDLWQAVLWHTEVEREPAASVGHLLGVDESGVDPLLSRATRGLRDAYLTAHERNSATNECRTYASMLSIAPRQSEDGAVEGPDRHPSQCHRCRRAQIELTAIDEQLGFILPLGVLLWGGPVYAVHRMVETCRSTDDRIPATHADHALVDDRIEQRPWAGSPLRSGMVACGLVTALGLAILTLPEILHGQDEAPSAAASQVEPEWTPPAFDVPLPTLSRPTSQPSPTASPRRASPTPVASVTAADQRPTAAMRPPLGPVTWSGALRNAGVSAQCVESAGTGVVQNPCNGSSAQVWEAVSFKAKPGYYYLRNAASGECIDYHVGVQRLHGNAVDIEVAMGPCRYTAEGQLFRFDPFAGTSGDSSYLLRAELDAAKPWNEMQLGMRDWWDGEGATPPPERNAPVVLTYHYYNAVRLHYLAEGRAPAPSAPSSTAAAPPN